MSEIHEVYEREVRGLVKGKRWFTADALGEPDARQAAGTEQAVRAQPEAAESLSAQREPGSTLDVPLRRRCCGTCKAGLTSSAGSGCGPFKKLAQMLLDQFETATLNYYRTKVPLGRRGSGKRQHQILVAARSPL